MGYEVAQISPSLSHGPFRVGHNLPCYCKCEQEASQLISVEAMAGIS